MQANDLLSIVVSVAIIVIALSTPAIFMTVRQATRAIASTRQLEVIEASVEIAVLAVEQMGLSGSDAKNTAIRVAQESLSRYGIVVEDEYVGMLVEAIVKELFNMSKAKV